MGLGKILIAALASAMLCGCAHYDYTGSLNTAPRVGVLTTPGEMLAKLPAPTRPISVAVYDFQDLTGQNKSSATGNYAEYSRAITQGASAMLVDSLKSAGRGSWFNVVERGYLDSLLRERKLIQDTYLFLKKNPRKLIDPLQFADYLVTGGVVSFDSSIGVASASGGFAGYQGGFSANRDLVTINLRLVRVRDGEVITSINVSRPILALSGSASAARLFRGDIVAAQAAAGLNEATQTAVRECIETGVYELVRQGVHNGLWQLPDGPGSRADATPPGTAARG